MTPKKKRILFVDDEDSIVESLGEFLSIRGFEAVGLTDPIKAEKRWQEEEFDIALVDLSMPVPEGYDVTSVEHGRITGITMAARMHKAKPNIPIIALTVVPEEIVRHRLRQAGILKLINKPAEPSFLVDALVGAMR